MDAAVVRATLATLPTEQALVENVRAIVRLAPALNLMAVGFPVILICGLLVLVVSVPQLLSGFERLLEQSFGVLQTLSSGRI